MENVVELNQLLKNYSGKKVFLTGHTGFKGSWLLTWLLELGAIVKGYALAPENSMGLYNIINNDDSFQSVIADIRDKKYDPEIHGVPDNILKNYDGPRNVQLISSVVR